MTGPAPDSQGGHAPRAGAAGIRREPDGMI